MITGLQPIPIKDLKALNAPKIWGIEGHLEELPSLTPVRGFIAAEHQGNVLNVHAELETIINLLCDRCLSAFNQKLACKVEEVIWLGKTTPNLESLENDLLLSHGDLDLVESLDPTGFFDPEHWAFEQLNLQIPLKKYCGKKCINPTDSLKTSTSENLQTSAGESDSHDPRWHALKKLISK